MEAAYRVQADILKALAHPSRIRMVGELANGARCVTHLRNVVGDSLSTVSRHLAVLRSVGIVDTRKDGLKVYYSLRAPCLVQFLDCLQAATDVRRPPSSGGEQQTCQSLPAGPPHPGTSSSPGPSH
ncbi:MAG TPA: metalloregulator ArsR/SmtB family transcription factor [Chthonomonadales bacterium]|nr:metalloregulator ArsR/SmtB family transcription factor [Chthonomonadales bacterium]